MARPEQPVLYPQYQYPQYQPAYAPHRYAAPPKPWYRRRLVAMLAGLVALLAICVVAAVGFVVNQNNNAKALAARTTIQVPATLNGLKKVQSAALTSSFVAAASEFPNLTGYVDALYGTPSGQPGILLFAGKSTVAQVNIRKSLNSFEAGMARGAKTAVDFLPVAPGPLGGDMDCASFAVQSVPLRMCAFMDSAAFGMICQYFDQASDTGEALMARNLIETRR